MTAVRAIVTLQTSAPYNTISSGHLSNNGDLYSALITISATRFTIARTIESLIKRDSITLVANYVTITTIFKYMP